MENKKELNQLIAKIDDLYLQATKEKSHYYTGSLLREIRAYLLRPSQEVERNCQECKKWQAMAESFVGISMLADEFSEMPHTPELFGEYVKNLLSQISEKKPTPPQEWDDLRLPIRQYMDFHDYNEFAKEHNYKLDKIIRTHLSKPLRELTELTPEKLHEWYLLATQHIKPNSFNPKAQRPYAELTYEQQFIDKYICDQIKNTFGTKRLSREEIEDIVEKFAINKKTQYMITNTDGENKTREFDSGCHIDISGLAQALHKAMGG